MKKIFIGFFLLLAHTIAFSQQFEKDKLDSLFQTLATNNKFMGSFAISQNGKLIYTNVIGNADVETKQKATVDSKYRIGSISKVFTSTLVFKAVEEGKLNLNETLDKYFPSIKNASKIKIENLLNHRSGIYNFTNDPSYPTWMVEQKTQDQLVKIISDAPSDFEPGSKAAYSNSNYVLLTFILEKVYQKSFKDILLTKIVNPLKLKNTYFGSKINLANKEVNSYAFTGEWKKLPETDMSIPLGAGAVVATPTDLTIFLSSLLEGKIINQKSLATMKTIRDGYGMGLFPYQYDGQTGYGHSGGIDGFTSLVQYYEKDRLTLAVTSNANTYGNDQLILAGLNAFYGKPVTIPNFKTIALKTTDLDQYLGEYAAPNFPLKITIAKKDNIMLTQATGQPQIQMIATGKDIFEFPAAGIVLEFKPAEKQMILKQGGGKYIFTKP